VRGDAIKRARILIVDDELANVRLLERLLEREGYTNLKSTTDPSQVLPFFTEFRPDLVLLDLLMPHLDGFAIMERLKPRALEDGYLPILVLTADVSVETKRRALSAGARDFLTKPFDAMEVLLRIKNLLETRSLHLELQEQNELLETMVRERTERLIQAEKMAALGRLAAGVAHELRNPLTVIDGRVQLLRNEITHGQMPPLDGLSRSLEKLGEAVGRMRGIMEGLSSYSKPRKHEPILLDMGELLSATRELVAGQAKKSQVSISVDVSQTLPRVLGDRSQLTQVLVNLATNAIEAIGDTGGQLTLKARPDGEGAEQRVRVEVSDTGPGIPSEVLPKIWEAFYTSKPEGTGLGLSIVRGLVSEQPGTTIDVESVPGRGTTFILTMPIPGAGGLTDLHPSGEEERHEGPRDAQRPS